MTALAHSLIPLRLIRSRSRFCCGNWAVYVCVHDHDHVQIRCTERDANEIKLVVCAKRSRALDVPLSTARRVCRAIVVYHTHSESTANNGRCSCVLHRTAPPRVRAHTHTLAGKREHVHARTLTIVGCRLAVALAPEDDDDNDDDGRSHPKKAHQCR